jgi:predicted nucleic acid-binding protein
VAIIIADTGPINYLVLIDAIDLLPKLFDQVIVPQAVFVELTDPDTPAIVRSWMTRAPAWFSVRSIPGGTVDPATAGLDAGEQAAIAIAMMIHDALLLMDERAGVAVARAKGLAATGTLGILDLAARHGMIDLNVAFDRLKATSFHYRQGLLDSLLARHRSET